MPGGDVGWPKRNGGRAYPEHRLGPIHGTTYDAPTTPYGRPNGMIAAGTAVGLALPDRGKLA